MRCSPTWPSRANPAADIVLLDTQYLFAETWWFVEEMQQAVRHQSPRRHARVPRSNATTCGRPTSRVLRRPQGRAAATARSTARRPGSPGVRRVDGPTRANAPVVSFDIGRNLVKINPLAAWTDDDMALYIEINDLPANPLSERGYPSIGCWPCTRPVAEGEDARGGRWAGNSKTECGLHV